MGKGERGGRVWGGEGLKVQKRFFESQEFFFVMMIMDSPPLGQSTSRLNFYDDSRCSPLPV
jgi:hypothetical protein